MKPSMNRPLARHLLRSIAVFAIVIGFPSFVTEAAEVHDTSPRFAPPEATRELSWIGGQAIALGGPAVDALAVGSTAW
jgi:hypothetical protein